MGLHIFLTYYGFFSFSTALKFISLRVPHTVQWPQRTATFSINFLAIIADYFLHISRAEIPFFSKKMIASSYENYRIL